VTAKPLRLRPRARADIAAITRHYASEAGETVALAFVAALQTAFAHMAAHPASGSLRHAEAAGIPGLRFWPLRRFPYLLLYLDRDDHLDVVRVLHARRDLPAQVREKPSVRGT
jgi:toxin ParE1/3/4